MTTSAPQSLTVVVERDLPHPPAKIWRALTQPALLAQWLMQNDFAPQTGHAFQFRANWGSVDCRVLAIEADQTLSYTWGAYGLVSIVTWTLTPTAGGTRLRMEQSGFRADQQQAYQGAKAGWPPFLGKLQQLLTQIA